jgi:hypothetical protein
LDAAVVSLVDPNAGALAQDDCLDSGAVTPISMALSGDVVLASTRNRTGELLLTDRTNSAVALFGREGQMGYGQEA